MEHVETGGGRLRRVLTPAALVLVVLAAGAAPASGLTREVRAPTIAAAGTPDPGLTAPAPTTTAPGAAVGERGPLTPLKGVLDYLKTRDGVVQVAVYNATTGALSFASDGSAPQATASIAKVDVLAMWLHNYQEQGVAVPGGIPFSIKFEMQQMIQDSVNAAATALFYFGGGCSALSAFNTQIPTANTNVGCQSPIYYGWGDTTTSAIDQVNIVRTLAYPNPLLGSAARAYGLGLMENISPGQDWGITCGPWGSQCAGPGYASPVPGVTVAMKDGWKYAPGCVAQNQICPWQMNSIGWVSGKGRNYVIAVLTGYDPAGAGLYGYDYGIDTIQGVSQRVWNNLAPSS